MRDKLKTPEQKAAYDKYRSAGASEREAYRLALWAGAYRK